MIDHQSDTSISLIRSTPPIPRELGELVRRTLQSFSGDELFALMRAHKFVGTDEDRAIGARWLAGRLGTPPDPDRIVLTNGTQNALLIAILTMVGTGNTLLVEDVGYYGLRRLARMVGIRVQPVPIDAEGVLPDAFALACRTCRPKALFLQPTLHNPTTAVMSEDRRREIADVARRHGVFLIEDDVYGMLARAAPPPIAALAPDVAWYATGLAKCIAPGTRLGYLVAPDAAAARRSFEALNTTSTWHAAPLSAALAAAWIEDGTVEILRQGVQDEAERRQAIAARHLAGASFATKPQSLFLWLTLPERWSQQRFVEAARANGVILRSGSMFNFDERLGHQMRVVIGSPETATELERALVVLADILELERMPA
jgi:DNA-binding transcriptional MocR family regulator